MSTKKDLNKKAEQTKEVAAQTEGNAQENTQSEQKKQAAVVLFGQIGFNEVADFDGYITAMKQNDYSNVLGTLNMAIRTGVQRGAFSLEENEAVSVALRQLNAAFKAAPATPATDEPAN